MGFSNRLKEAREQKGLSRDDLAKRLGVTNSAISNYENGISSPKEEVLLKIFDILEVEPNFLFQDDFSKANFSSPPTKKEIKLFESYQRAKNSDDPRDKAVAEAVEKLLGLNE